MQPWGLPIPEQWIKPTAEHQQPAAAQAYSRQAPPPPLPASKIYSHPSDYQQQSIAAAQHQQQQAKPEPGSAVALGPDRQSEGGHHPGFGVKIK